MKKIIEPAREIAIDGEYDVIVSGGGTAGVIAAIAAVRNGASTLLIERGGFIGGHIATQLLEHSVGWFDADGNQVVGGLANELVDRLIANGASPGHVRDDTGYTRKRLPIEHELFKSVVCDWLAKEGVELLIHTPAVSVIEQNDETFVVVESKSGRLAYRAYALIDATGDADLCAYSGCEFLSDVDGETQPVSMLFKMAGVDNDKVLDYVNANSADFKLGIDPHQMRGEDFINLWGFGQLLAKGFEDGILSLNRNELHYSGHVKTGEAVINVTRYAVDATNAREMGIAEAALRLQVMEFVRFFQKRVPGFENSFLSATAACAGVRESRRIKGTSVLTDNDVRSGAQASDAVARGGFPMDSHDSKGNSMDGTEHVPSGYDIPLGVMLPTSGPNMIVAGRCISAERKALASARITGTCIAMGQAAGTAAAISAKTNTHMKSLNVRKIQKKLLEQGAIFAGRMHQ